MHPRRGIVVQTKKDSPVTYAYRDLFLTDSLPPEELEAYEVQAIKDVSKLQITDPDYIARLVVARVYMLAARVQYESEGMQEKYKVYEKEYDRALREAIIAAKETEGIKDSDTVWSVKVGRS